LEVPTEGGPSCHFPVVFEKRVVALGVHNFRAEAFGLFTGQVGYAWNNVLWYVKGGAAVTDDKYRGTVTATGAPFDSANETRWGGVVGRTSNSDSHRIGRLRSSTITFSWVAATSPPHRQAMSAVPPKAEVNS
jgi:hypothetical protein